MTGFLLDTNVLSELRKPSPNAGVVRFVSERSLASLFVSTVTLAELRFGIEILAETLLRAELSAWLNSRIRPMFAGRTLPISEDVMVVWRTLVEAGRKRNHTFAQPDLIIAATAMLHDLTVVSRDVSGFAQSGVRLINPWADQ